MGLRHDLTAWLAGRSRPRYGDSLRFAGSELPTPQEVSVPTRHGAVRCLRYRGDHELTLLHLHGGAFVMRRPEMDDFWARFVLATTGIGVVLPDYDVAPRHRYPVAHEQCQDIADRMAGDGPLVVSGFSAGGNLAAAVALSGLSLRGQLLGVPSVDIAEDVGAKAARVPHGMLTPALLRMVRESYFRDASRRADPSASPLHAPDLTGLPPAFVVTAENDVLRPEGDAYAERLAAAGVAVEHVVAPGADHYFLNGLPAAGAEALMHRMADWVAAR